MKKIIFFRVTVTKSLFDQPHRGTKLERRQSVAVMQSSNKTPKHSWKSPRRRKLFIRYLGIEKNFQKHHLKAKHYHITPE